MSEPLEKPATYEDLLQAPAHLVAEIINGRLRTHPRPAPKHARASASLGGELFGPFDKGSGGPGGWWILDDPELHLEGQVLVPDLAGWRRERMPKLPDTAWFDTPPDWICEILSPATARIDRAEKMPVYLQVGVSNLWLLDPDIRVLEAYANLDGRWVLLSVLENDDQVSIAPFDAIAFSLGALWVD